MPPINSKKLIGLVAAPYTPFGADGSLHTAAIWQHAALLRESGVRGAFIWSRERYKPNLSTAG